MTRSCFFDVLHLERRKSFKAEQKTWLVQVEERMDSSCCRPRGAFRDQHQALNGVVQPNLNKMNRLLSGFTDNKSR